MKSFPLFCSTRLLIDTCNVRLHVWLLVNVTILEIWGADWWFIFTDLSIKRQNLEVYHFIDELSRNLHLLHERLVVLLHVDNDINLLIKPLTCLQVHFVNAAEVLNLVEVGLMLSRDILMYLFERNPSLDLALLVHFLHCTQQLWFLLSQFYFNFFVQLCSEFIYDLLDLAL